MSFLFGGKQKTPEEVMKEYKRSIDRSIREMDRECLKLQTTEKKLIIEIKKCAKESQQMAIIQIKAKDLVRTRGMITKFYTMKSQMQSVSLRLQSVKSTQAMQEAMKGAAKAMHKMNAQTDLSAMNKIMQEFERENDIMTAKQEDMDEALDDMFQVDGEEGKIDDVVSEVLAEIGIDTKGQMAPAAGGRVAAQTGPEVAEEDLEARLNNLKTK